MMSWALCSERVRSKMWARSFDSSIGVSRVEEVLSDECRLGVRGASVCVDACSCGLAHGASGGLVFEECSDGFGEGFALDDLEAGVVTEGMDGLDEIVVGGSDDDGHAERGGLDGIGAEELAEASSDDGDVGECVGGFELSDGVEEEAGGARGVCGGRGPVVASADGGVAHDLGCVVERFGATGCDEELHVVRYGLNDEFVFIGCGRAGDNEWSRAIDAECLSERVCPGLIVAGCFGGRPGGVPFHGA